MQYREELRLFPRSIRTYSSLAMLYRASNRDRDVEQVIDDLMDAAPTPEGLCDRGAALDDPWRGFARRGRQGRRAHALPRRPVAGAAGDRTVNESGKVEKWKK